MTCLDMGFLLFLFVSLFVCVYVFFLPFPLCYYFYFPFDYADNNKHNRIDEQVSPPIKRNSLIRKIAFWIKWD